MDIKNKYNILDCTLRDGGYITDWKFNDSDIRNIILHLVEANLDFIELGYLNSTKVYKGNTSQFDSIHRIRSFIPSDKGNSIMLAMADVEQFKPEDITEFDGTSIDGIRVVFYKHQVEQALLLSKAVKDAGYQLFVQPMVTIDYTMDEYAKLAEKISELNPYAVSIVDSFGYMIKEDVKKFYRILDNVLGSEVTIGFHSHNNMNLAFITAQDILEYQTTRRLIIDSSLYGMGRGAGNLNTELITNYYNMLFGNKYDIITIMDLISDYIVPISNKRSWGYSPFLFLTGLYHYHPNFACYLLDEHPEVTVKQFESYLHTIPESMKTKCRKPYVLEQWEKFNKYNVS